MRLKIKLILILLSLCTLPLSENTPMSPPPNKYNISIKEKQGIPNKKEAPIGTLTITKINLQVPLYAPTSKKNNVEENVTILKGSSDPQNKNTTLFLAAHSGTGKIAYFNNLNKLKLNDLINLNYNNHDYTYIVKDIFEIAKNGYISLPKENTNQLVLTTCSTINEGKQLIVNATIKDSI